MNLKKPPIVEMWVEFNFDPKPDKETRSSVLFLQKYAQEYPELEISQEDRLEFRQVSPTKLPEVVARKTAVKHIRVQDAEGARWMHLTATQLVFNYLRLGEKYPGFSALSEDALTKLGQYVEICKPAKLRHAAIHYVDVVEVPVPATGEIELRDYFLLGLDLPKNPFGSQLSYSVKTALQPPDGTGPLEIELQFLPIITEKRVFRFRLDWHKSCPYNNEVEPARVLNDLKLAHESVMRCFRPAFTDRTWQLFDPVD